MDEFDYDGRSPETIEVGGITGEQDLIIGGSESDDDDGESELLYARTNEVIQIARSIILNPSTATEIRHLQERGDKLGESVQACLPDPDRVAVEEYAEVVMQAAERKQRVFEPCERYYRND